MICSYIFFSQNNEFIQIALKSGSAAAAFHQMWFSKTVVKQRFLKGQKPAPLRLWR